MTRKIIRKLFVWLSVCTVILPLLSPITAHAQQFQKPSAQYVNEGEIRVDYPEFGVNYNLKKTSNGNFTGVYTVQKGFFGATADCGVLLSGTVVINNFTISASGYRIDSTNGTSINGCDAKVSSGMSSTVNINTANSTKPVQDTAGTKVIAAVVAIPNNAGLTDGGRNSIDINKAPEKDVIVVNDRSLTGPANQIARIEATRELGQGADVVYKANFKNIAPGNYQVCSQVVAKTCKDFTKVGGQILNAYIEADKTKYDIVKASGTTENTKTCAEEFGISSGWIVCAALELISNGVDTVFNFAESLLNVNAQELYSNAQLRVAWSYFRAISTFALLGVGLVMVIGQALGGDR